VTAAAFLEREADANGALDLYRRLEADHPRDPFVLRALVRSAEIQARNGDTTGARATLLRAKAHPGFGEPWRSAVERMLDGL
jgi:hypothetical protein